MKKLLMVLILAAPLGAQEALDFYVEQAKPVAEHQRLTELAGTWKVTTKLWFDPAGAPKVGSGRGTGKMILGGRFLSFETNLKGDFPQDSLSIFGFDRRTSEFTLVGYDTLGTYYITAAGKHDDAQKGIVLDGSYAQPPSGQEQKYRFVWTRPTANEHLMTLYFLINGKEERVAETRMMR